MSDPLAGRHYVPAVLVVDDENEVRVVTRRILEEAGYIVWEATGGGEALRLLTERIVDVVITDIRMPGMDGWQLAAVLKTMTPPKPVLFVSGYAAHTGAIALPGPVLAKPFRPAQLIDEVRRLLEDRQPRSA